MKRLITIALVLAVIGGMLFGLYKWDKEHRFYRLSWWNKVHYELNEPAYERLGRLFEEDPLIFSVSYFPQGTQQIEITEYERKVDATTEEIWEIEELHRAIDDQEERYEPILKDMRFPGPITFYDDPTLADSHHAIAGGSRFGDIEVSVRLLHTTADSVRSTRCPKRPSEQPSGLCFKHLGGNWWMRYSWFTYPPRERANFSQ
ncbi:MAG: hypothetical protein ACK4M6_06390 [Hyphomonas sp.]